MKLNAVRISPAVEADRSFFVHVHHTAYRAAIEKMFGWDKLLQDKYANNAFNEGGINLIWFEEEKIGVFGLDVMPDCLWVKELFILPNFQNQGVGGFILNQAIAQSIELGKDLKLRTLKVNERAKKLYEQHGLSVIEETDIHWVMSRRILTT